MNDETIIALNQLNSDFYLHQVESFSASRNAPWNGWERICDHIARSGRVKRVLDVACGNLRLERFLAEARPRERWEFTCIDSCDELVRSGDTASLGEFEYVHEDIIERLVSARPLLEDSPRVFDAAVSFGFMHHVPSAKLRIRLALELCRRLAPEGVAALSFWRFADDEGLAAKARESTSEAMLAAEYDLEENDYIVGWNGKAGTYRYCHSFTDAELLDICCALRSEAELIDRFSADGRNGRMNDYLVFRRRSVSTARVG